MKFTFFVLNGRKKIMLLLSFVLVAFLACNRDDNMKSKGELSSKKEIANVENDTTDIEEGDDKLPFDLPIAFASTKNIAIPIILLVKPQEKYDSDTYYMNIAVLNDGQSEARMVFDQSQIIESITTFEKRIGGSVDQDDDDGPVVNVPKTVNSLLFIEQVNCAECDGVYKKLFVYNLKINQLKQLSPEGYSVSNWHMFKENGKVLMKCIIDKNKDGEYGEDEEEVIFVSDFNKPDSKPIKMGVDVDKLKKQRTRLLKEFYQPTNLNNDED